MPFLPEILYTRFGDRLRTIRPLLLAAGVVVVALIITGLIVMAFIMR